jgi:hypothetical protein
VTGLGGHRGRTRETGNASADTEPRGAFHEEGSFLLKQSLARWLRMSPAMILAMLALLVALGGVSTAASITSSPEATEGSSASAAQQQIRGPRGKRGPRGLRGRTGARGPMGPAAPAGAPGAQGAQGLQGSQGAKGDNGVDLTASSTLAPGQTISGPWGMSTGDSTSGYAFTAIEFRPHLAADLAGGNAHYQAPGTTSANCPGHKQAAPGHLCVYGSSVSALTFGSFTDPQSHSSGVRAMGTVMYFNIPGTAGDARGTWAVTAP